MITSNLTLPQWLQHEIFHHFYRIYPELMLEVNGHDWFNLDFWPDDFEGRFEPDYYAKTPAYPDQGRSKKEAALRDVPSVPLLFILP